MAARMMILALAVLVVQPAHALDRQAIRKELNALKRRIARLEKQLDEADKQAQKPPVRHEDLDTAPVPAHTRRGKPEHKRKLAVDLGGAVRLNYSYRRYNRADRKRTGQFGFELFRADVDLRYDKLYLSAQYRFYPDFEAVHHAYFGYRFNDRWNLQAGINKVPFGILPYASHSYWFGGTYYMGLEDDYDSGVKVIHNSGPWNVQLAFYKNPEYTDSSRYNRYSFDLATGGNQQNEEVNQYNARVAYRFDHGSGSYTTLGFSTQYGGIYNTVTGDTGDRYAVAAHVDGHYGPWNVQLEAIDFRMRPKNPVGVSDNTVQMAAFGYPFLMTSAARVLVFNVARRFDVHWGPIESVTCYNDHTRLYPRHHDQKRSVQNVTGCSIAGGDGFLTYIDWIAGRNMWFAGGPGIGLDDDSWHSRLNVNIGYYF